MTSELLILLGLVAVNGLLSGAEIAIVSLRDSRLRELVDEGSRAARAVAALRGQPERFLATVQIGITVVGATAGAFGGATFADRLTPIVARVPALAPFAPQLSLALVIVAVSYLSLVLGELVPKSLALRRSEQYALAVSRPLLRLSSVVRPVVWFLTASSNLFLRPFRDHTDFLESRVSQEEIQRIVADAARAGTVHPGAGEIASRALDFSDLTVADVMVPRRMVASIPRGATRDELRRILLEEGHTRMPVYEGRTDNVVGYVSAKDVLALAWDPSLLVLEDLLRPPFFVPEWLPAVELLKQMREERKPFAIAVDERGGMTGLVTIEDLLEEMVGEIFSEREQVIPTLIRREPDGSVVVLGEATVRDVNRALSLSLPEDGDFTTLAGLYLSEAGRIPAPGERLTLPDGTEIEVVDASPRRVRVLRIRAAAGTRPGVH